MAERYALFASAAFFDEVVEQTFVRRGQPMVIGGTQSLAVPVPTGAPFIARVHWTGPDGVVVLDGRGRQYHLGPEADLILEVGPVKLTLSLVRQFSFKRVAPPSPREVVSWLAVWLMVTLSMQQLGILHEYRCEIGPLVFGASALQIWPECIPPDVAANSQNALTAEYLARLLQDDLSGAEKGVITRDLDRPEAERRSEHDRQFFMPAGADGPITEMGGAEETALEPDRSPEPDEALPVPDGGSPEPLFAPEDVGTEIPLPDHLLAPDEGMNGIAAVDEDEHQAQDFRAPAEEEEGWGIPDWYDELDALQDEMEIEVMLRAAQYRLLIDPNDPYALSVLSYYQYLAQDYAAAETTYDHYIQLLPEDAAGYNNKALIFKRRADYETEESLYRVALALEPQDVTALNNLAVNLAHQGRYDEALAVMAKLELLDPDDAYAELHRAKIYADLGDDEQALRYLDKALAGMAALDTLHHIEFRQDIRLDPSFEDLRRTHEFRELLWRYYGEDTPLQE